MKTFVKKLHLWPIVAIFSLQLAAHEKAIIGHDGRQLSNFPQVGRMLLSYLSKKACTATLIGRTCMVSAGHCQNVMNYVDFNTPTSVNGKMRMPKAWDHYKIDQKSIVYRYSYPTSPDWAVFRLQKNKHVSKWKRFWNRYLHPKKPIAKKYLSPNGYYAGDIQGFYKVKFGPIFNYDFVRITGYGLDERKDRNQAQQTALGYIKSLTPINSTHTFLHDVDTRQGNSGAGVIEEHVQELIGVHTHQRCPNTSEVENRIYCKNAANGVYQNPEFAQAIKDCLKWEEENLE